MVDLEDASLIWPIQRWRAGRISSSSSTMMGGASSSGASGCSIHRPDGRNWLSRWLIPACRHVQTSGTRRHPSHPATIRRAAMARVQWRTGGIAPLPDLYQFDRSYPADRLRVIATTVPWFQRSPMPAP